MSELVEQRAEGLYCPAGDFYIDPSKRVARAVITHAHGDHARTGMGHYWAAAPGGGLLRERIGRQAAVTLPAYGTAFPMGRARVSLHSAGHILGSAQVRIEVDGEVWVVSGDYKRCADASCAPFEVQPCDVFVTETTFAKPEFVWPATGVVAEQIFHWWQDCRAQGLAAVLFCYALGKAQRVLAELLPFSQDTVLLHPNMTDLVKAYRKEGVALIPTAPFGAPPKGKNFAGELILAPPSVRGTRWLNRIGPYSGGFASGWMQQTDSKRTQSYQRGFVLSDHADWPSLLRTIAETGARRIRTMHGDDALLISHLQAQGLDAGPLKGSELHLH